MYSLHHSQPGFGHRHRDVAAAVVAAAEAELSPAKPRYNDERGSTHRGKAYKKGKAHGKIVTKTYSVFFSIYWQRIPYQVVERCSNGCSLTMRLRNERKSREGLL